MATLANLVVNLTAETAQFRRSMERSTRQTQQQFQAMERAANGVKRAATAMLGVLGTTVSVREYVRLSDQFTQMQGRLRLATDSAQEFAQAQSDSLRISGQYGQELSSITGLIARLEIVTAGQNVTLQENIQTVEALAAGFKIMGATQQESASATLQFAQAMGSGVLRGEEFNAVFEASPRIMMAIADGMGVAVGELRNMASAGELTADVVRNALISQLEILKAEAAEIPPTFSAAFNSLRNAVLLSVGAFNEATGAAAGLIAATQTFGEAIQYMTGATDDASASARVLAGLLEAALVVAIARLGGAAAASASAMAQQTIAALGGAAAARAKAQALAAQTAALAASLRATIAAGQGNTEYAATLRASVASLARQTAAAQASAASMTVAARAAGGLRTALALLGGPAGILVALGTAAFMYREELSALITETTGMTTASQRLAEDIEQAELAVREQAGALDIAIDATIDAATESGKLTVELKKEAQQAVETARAQLELARNRVTMLQTQISVQQQAIDQAAKAAAQSDAWGDSVRNLTEAQAANGQTVQATTTHIRDMERELEIAKAESAAWDSAIGDATQRLDDFEKTLGRSTGTVNTSTPAVERNTGARNSNASALKEQTSELEKQLRSIMQAKLDSEQLLAIIETENVTREQATTLLNLENAAREAGIEITEQQRGTILATIEATEANQQAISDLTTETKTGTDLMAESWKTLSNNIQNLFAGTFERLFTGAWDGWRSLLDSMWRYFAQFAAQIASQRLLTGGALFGMGGSTAAQAGQATGGNFIGGFGSALSSGLGSVLGSIGLSVGGALAGIAPTFASGVLATSGLIGAQGIFAGGAAALSNIGSLVATGDFIAALGAAAPILLPIAIGLSTLIKDTPPRAHITGMANSGELIQVVEKKGQDAEGLIELLNGIVDATSATLSNLGGQLGDDDGQFRLHINPDRLRFTFVPDSGPMDVTMPPGWADRLEIDVDPSDQAAVGDAVAKMILAATTQADFSEAAEPIGAFFESLSLDMIEALPQGAAEQIIGQFHNIGEAATAAGEQFPWLAQAIRDTAETSDIGAQELAQYTLSLIAIGQALSTEPAELYAQALEASNRTMLETLSAQGDQVQTLAGQYDGSAASAQALAEGVLALQQSAVQALAQIDAARQSVTDSVTSARQQIELSLMSQAEKVEYWLGEADRLRDELAAATDPSEINRLAQDTTAALLQAWQNMDEDRRGSEAEFIQAFLDSIDDTAATGLDAAAAEVHEIWTDAAHTVETTLSSAAAALSDAADAIRAAGDQLSAAIPDTIHVSSTVTITPGTGSERARGGFVHAASGWIGHAAQRGLDSIPVMVGAGEAIINAWQQRWIEPALRSMYGFGLDGLFARESRTHSSAPAMSAPVGMPTVPSGGRDALALEIRALRREMSAAQLQIAKNTGKTWRRLDRWDLDGLPPERT